MLTHRCWPDNRTIHYGAAFTNVLVYEQGEQIDDARETIAKGGETFVSNREYGSFVNVCPLCGKTGSQLLAERDGTKPQGLGKVTVFLKDTQVFREAVYSEIIKRHFPKPPSDLTPVIAMREPYLEKMEKFVTFLEIVEIEFDLDAGTATVKEAK